MIAIYRKYRPSLFEELLGQGEIVQILKSAAEQNRLAHAYLLSGPRGTGKTTTARLIAKIANCKKINSEGEPCNACESCLQINEGRNLDIIEIDAASNRGIDEIRELRESVRLTPTQFRYKVFIIDEAHMLTKDAFNALLKTLEEPPAHAIIILATTEIEKIPITISSRAQQLYFKRVSNIVISKKIKTIAKAEDVEIDNEAVELIASSAEGSLRDAESLLDQLISFNDDKKITISEVEKVLGKVGFDTLAKFAEAVIKNDIDSALSGINKIQNNGYNLNQFTKDLIQYLRRALVLKFNPQMKEGFKEELMEEHLNKLTEHSLLINDKSINLLKNLISAYSQMRYSQFPIIPLEIAIIESLK